MASKHHYEINNPDGTITEFYGTERQLDKFLGKNKLPGRPRGELYILPDELKAWRKVFKYSQERLAARLKVSRLTVFNWEHGKTNPPVDIPQRLNGIAYVDAMNNGVDPDTIIFLKTGKST